MEQVIVIGGGILGTATAWRLAERGVTVTLLEAGPVLGGGASRASFAWLNASTKPPKPYHQLNVDGMSAYRGLQSELGNPRWLHVDGHVEWDASKGGAERIRAKVARLRDWGYTAELRPIAELADIEPDMVAPEAVETFAWYPQEGYVDPVDMIGEFAARARRAGATIRTGVPVAELVHRGGRVSGAVTTSGETLEADVVVSATGARSPVLLEKFGLALPMAPTIGMVAVSAPTTVRLATVHHDHLMNIHPDGAGRIVMRHTDFDRMCEPGMPERPLPSFLRQLVDRVSTVLPGIAGIDIETMRVAVRPIPADGKPVIGTVPGVDGLYLMVTHSAVTMGPLLAQIAAREITTGVPDGRLADFRPDRTIATAIPTLENG